MALFRQSPGFIIRAPYPLPKKRERVKSGIARAPKRIWLRHRRFVKSHQCCRHHHQEEEACGPDTFGDRHGIDLWAIAAELVRRSPDVQMRLSLMLEEEGAR
jgi:hypothetical protein